MARDHIVFKTLFGRLQDEDGRHYRILIQWNPAGPEEAVTQSLIISLDPEPVGSGVETGVPAGG